MADQSARGGTGGSLRSGLRAMGADSWPGVLFELDARPSDLRKNDTLPMCRVILV